VITLVVRNLRDVQQAASKRKIERGIERLPANNHANALATLIHFCQGVKESDGCDGFAHVHPISLKLELNFGAPATEECTLHLAKEPNANPFLFLNCSCF